MRLFRAYKSWPGLSRPSTSLPKGCQKDVDARDNPRIKSGDGRDGECDSIHGD